MDCLKKIIDTLDIKLGDQKYFGGELSVADILYYSDISTITCFSGKQILPDHSNIKKWYVETMQCPEVEQLDAEMRRCIEEF